MSNETITLAILFALVAGFGVFALLEIIGRQR
jgi:hypothetical protein